MFLGPLVGTMMVLEVLYRYYPSLKANLSYPQKGKKENSIDFTAKEGGNLLLDFLAIWLCNYESIL